MAQVPHSIPGEGHGFALSRAAVLIGLERPLWAVQRCGSSWEEIHRQEEQERKTAGSDDAQVTEEFLKYVRKVRVWRFHFDSEMSYPRAATRP